MHRKLICQTREREQILLKHLPYLRKCGVVEYIRNANILPQHLHIVVLNCRTSESTRTESGAIVPVTDLKVPMLGQ